MKGSLWIALAIAGPLISLGLIVRHEYNTDTPLTSDAAPYRDVAYRVKCAELRTEFFAECQQTMTRQQCEALYGQTRGQLFEGRPELAFNRQLDCSGE